MIVYKIDVLKTLNESGYTPGKLRKEKLLGENAIQCLRENKMVGIKALDKICTILAVSYTHLTLPTTPYV